MTGAKARPSMGRSLTACPKGHKSDSAAQFCPNCGEPKGSGDEKRLPMMVRAKSTSQHKLGWLANHLSHGHMGEAFEEAMDFTSEVVNGKASPEQVREMQTTLTKLAKRTWEIMLRENADLQYAVRKAAKELGEANS